MPLRHARRSDIPIMAKVIAASFAHDKLFQVMYPHQEQYPEDYETSWQRHLYVAWWDYSKVLMLSYESVAAYSSEHRHDSLTTTTNGPAEVITGFSEWTRIGLGWEQYWGVLGWWDPRLLIKKLVEWRNTILYFFRPCRAAARPTPSDPDPLLHSNFVQRCALWMAPLMEDPTKPWRRNMWMLDLLAVHPGWQGRGCGRELAQWGLRIAKEDRVSGRGEVPAVVVSAEGKEGFYLKAGFDEIAGYQTDEVEGIREVNPLRSRGIGGGAVIWSWVAQDEDFAASEGSVKAVESLSR